MFETENMLNNLAETGRYLLLKIEWVMASNNGNNWHCARSAFCPAMFGIPPVLGSFHWLAFHQLSFRHTLSVSETHAFEVFLTLSCIQLKSHAFASTAVMFFSGKLLASMIFHYYHAWNNEVSLFLQTKVTQKNETIHRAGPVYSHFTQPWHRAGPVLSDTKMTIHRAGPVYSHFSHPWHRAVLTWT